MNFKVGDKIKLRYFKNEEEYNFFRENKQGFDYDLYMKFLYNKYLGRILIVNKIDLSCNELWCIGVPQNLLYFQIKKVSDFKQKIKFIKDLL